MKIQLTPEQAAEARKAMAEGVARFGSDANLFGQVRLALGGEDHAGELALFSITIPPATGRKVHALLERERIRLAKEAKPPPAGAQREGGLSTGFASVRRFSGRIQAAG